MTKLRKITIYHNPRCSKSRETLTLLEKMDAEIKVIEYLKAPPSVAELDKLLKQLGLEPEAIVRKKEDLFVQLKLAKRPPQDRKAWIKILTENPVLIERPIVTNGKEAVLGRPPQNVKKLI